ncbi:MAG: hypothetical protein KAR06_06050 [Deltaproteobacteria bacterium]|nr:hypothetical protein [Deltaproteobacteria bacterium]
MVTKAKKPKKTATKRKPAVKAKAKSSTTKNPYLKKLETELKKIETQIVALKKKKPKLDKKLHAGFKKTTDALNKKKVVAKKRLKEVNAAWREVTKGMDKAWKELKASLGDAKTKFK